MGDLSVADDDLEAADDRTSLHGLWRALIAGRTNDAARFYKDDAELRLPQTDEVLTGRTAISSRGLLRDAEQIVKVNKIFGTANIWISECEGRSYLTPMLVISIALMDDGTIVSETRYWVPLHSARAETTGA